jgi:hypothetical protein
MIVVVLVGGGGFGWFAHLARQARIQRESVAAVHEAGGSVLYNWDSTNGKLIFRGEPWAPEWLVDLIGVDYFGHVTVVSLEERGADAQIGLVARFDGVERLYLWNTRVSEPGLANLKWLSNLSVLAADGSQLTDAGLAHLKGLTKLSEVFLRGAQFTDEGKKALQHALPNLRINQ